MNSAAPGTAVSDAEYVEIQRFMHHEAALLDRRDFMAWLDLLTGDIGYRISAQVARQAEVGPEHYAIVDEDADSLGLRVRQIADPMKAAGAAMVQGSRPRSIASASKIGMISEPVTVLLEKSRCKSDTASTMMNGRSSIGISAM